MKTRHRVQIIAIGAVIVALVFTGLACNRDPFAGKPSVQSLPFDYSRPGHPPFDPSFFHGPSRHAENK